MCAAPLNIPAELPGTLRYGKILRTAIMYKQRVVYRAAVQLYKQPMSDSQLYLYIYIYIFSELLPGVPWVILRNPETPGEPVELPGELQGAPGSSRELLGAPWGSLASSLESSLGALRGSLEALWGCVGGSGELPGPSSP